MWWAGNGWINGYCREIKVIYVNQLRFEKWRK